MNKIKKKQKKVKTEEADFEITNGNVFEDLKLEQPEELLVRSTLLMQVGDLIENSGFSQQDVAKKLGITQPKVSMLVSGRLSAFTSETLFHYLSILGCEVEIRVKKPLSHTGIFKQKGCISVC
jgi:predicted XRE-type DNA-binding protein